MDLNRTLQLVNKSVRDLAAYHLVPEEVPVKLNQNENPYDWPADIKNELALFCKERAWNRYPPFVPDDLKAALASYAGVGPENVLAGNGSNEMLLVLFIALLNRGVPLIICQPTFTVYTLLSQGLGNSPISVMLKPDLAFDIDAIIATLQKNPGCPCIICSPNNPTGSVLGEADCRRILGASAGFVILDQAYVEFGGYNAVPLVAEYPNLIVARTSSKAFAAAGVRLGYMIGAADIIGQLNKIKLPYNLNFFSAKVVETAVKYKDRMASTITELRRSRDDLAAFLKTLPFDKVYPSEANFILVRCKDKQGLFDGLKERGILVRDVSHYPMLADCLRISVGSLDENRQLKDALSDILKG
jgi:histidinol-phosphate aminotransferase